VSGRKPIKIEWDVPLDDAHATAYGNDFVMDILARIHESNRMSPSKVVLHSCDIFVRDRVPDNGGWTIQLKIDLDLWSPPDDDPENPDLLDLEVRGAVRSALAVADKNIAAATVRVPEKSFQVGRE
jgi:hypothetical protein